MNNKISIIIPFYNTQIEYLEACINSAMNQTIKNIEIILINDGSDSFYDAFLEQYKGKIKIIKTENKGVSAARNLGMKIATGEWITFLDADDFLELNACDTFLKTTKETPDIDIVISKTRIHNGETLTENYTYQNENHKVINKNELIESIFLNENNKYTCVDTPWAKLYKKVFLKKSSIEFNETLTNGEDGLFNFMAYYEAENIFFNAEKTYNYRVNPYSTCSSYSEDLNIKFSNLLNAYKKTFDEENILEYDKMLSLYALRVFCRLIRKYYSHCNSYEEFEAKINNESNAIYDVLFKDLKFRDVNSKKGIVLALHKLKCNRLLYLLSKSDIKIK